MKLSKCLLPVFSLDSGSVIAEHSTIVIEETAITILLNALNSAYSLYSFHCKRFDLDRVYCNLFYICLNNVKCIERCLVDAGQAQCILNKIVVL